MAIEPQQMQRMPFWLQYNKIFCNVGQAKATKFHHGYIRNYLQLIIFWMQYRSDLSLRRSKLRQRNYFIALATSFTVVATTPSIAMQHQCYHNSTLPVVLSTHTRNHLFHHGISTYLLQQSI